MWFTHTVLNCGLLHIGCHFVARLDIMKNHADKSISFHSTRHGGFSTSDFQNASSVLWCCPEQYLFACLISMPQFLAIKMHLFVPSPQLLRCWTVNSLRRFFCFCLGQYHSSLLCPSLCPDILFLLWLGRFDERINKGRHWRHHQSLKVFSVPFLLEKSSVIIFLVGLYSDGVGFRLYHLYHGWVQWCKSWLDLC